MAFATLTGTINLEVHGIIESQIPLRLSDAAAIEFFRNLKKLVEDSGAMPQKRSRSKAAKDPSDTDNVPPDVSEVVR